VHKVEDSGGGVTRCIKSEEEGYWFDHRDEEYCEDWRGEE
jgi:hypothetical protein